ncbi:protein HOTHEAD-like [Diospyros lotus]|uniref:protein HOTHEAD-like n=1 Tax=Diospyros lotus TaxID=55363 RepID=UPI00225B5A57|nr:protein HOTHEAD-like [Diospyros lotus]XP_052208348.1 protein HOTHEAD-like [Diospyros lotus]XP_052208424.1 protein HOTHEAD-like [Diospyros lotus]
MASSGWLRISCVSAALLGVLLFHGSCFSEKAPYSSFAHDATAAPPVEYYDYIIVGGGTSGCALAATLSEGAKVLLLERGDLPYGQPTINNIATFAATLANNSPSSPSQSFVSTDGVINARARVLGGGSCLNAGFYTRASTAYVSRAGWDQRLVNESYQWVEGKVVFEPPMLEWQSAVRDGLLEAGVLPYNGFTFDHIYGTKVGGSTFDREGHRHTAADFLEYADPRKITVYLNAVVHQIFFTVKGQPKPRAYGVEFRDAKGTVHKAYLNRGSKNEVILSAGALGSPQLLMLSGVGPKEHLMAHGIQTIVDQPMVGQGMSDNSMNALYVPSPRPVEISLIQVVGITRFGSFVEAASGSQFGSVSPHSIHEYFQTLANQTGEDDAIFSSGEANSLSLQGGLILEKILGPESTGHLLLHTTDPNDNPIVTFNYFQDPRDLQRCVQGMKTIIKVIESKSFSKFRYPLVTVQALIDMMLALPVNVRPRHVSASFSLEQFCVDTVMTIWHYHGGCQVSKVVDRDYRVMGVEGLRVVDGSTFIRSPGTNPQATVMMLGRYMGQKILQQRK